MGTPVSASFTYLSHSRFLKFENDNVSKSSDLKISSSDIKEMCGVKRHSIINRVLDKLRDFFCGTEKSDVHEHVRNIICGCTPADQLKSFLALDEKYNKANKAFFNCYYEDREQKIMLTIKSGSGKLQVAIELSDYFDRMVAEGRDANEIKKLLNGGLNTHDGDAALDYLLTLTDLSSTVPLNEKSSALQDGMKIGLADTAALESPNLKYFV